MHVRIYTRMKMHLPKKNVPIHVYRLEINTSTEKTYPTRLYTRKKCMHKRHVPIHVYTLYRKARTRNTYLYTYKPLLVLLVLLTYTCNTLNRKTF